MDHAAPGGAAAQPGVDAGKHTATRRLAAPLEGVFVVEYGERLGTTVCGSLLAQLGAEVALIERARAAADHASASRACNALGKRSVVIQAGAPADEELLAQLMHAADIVLMSSDVSPAPGYARLAHQIVCDVTAFGATGPLAGMPLADALVQALSGLADTTGDPDGPPTLIGLPFCEISAGIYAAAATLIAHRVRRTRGHGQSIDVALFDCAVSALSTFLPFHMVGKRVTRAGNRHSLAAPWNAYRARDGWVLICTATDEQWRRLCKLIGRTELALAPGYTTNAERVAKRAEVDDVVQQWTTKLTVQECIERLSGIDIACGPILTLEQLAAEPNLAHRKTVRKVFDRTTKTELALPASPLTWCWPALESAWRLPVPGEDRQYLADLAAHRKRAASRAMQQAEGQLPLAGLRVIEIGQYTTAPLVARQLGAFGAEVFKIEPPGGEAARAWPPTQGDCGYFFVFSNSDKKSLELDLRREADREHFRALLRTADVLVENLKPGSLARLGFGPEELLGINSRLIYCGISGFGADSAYPGRPAFDTVVQAMSGFMDLTRTGGAPVKAGISAADIVGGEFGLLAILGALEMRDRCNQGQVLDISMQDAAVWATAARWNAKPASAEARFVRCADGYACIEGPRDVNAALGLKDDGASAASTLTREALLERARRAGIPAAAVCTVSQVAESSQTAARELILRRAASDGRTWPLLNSPMRLERTPAQVKRPIGELGEANAELRLS